MATEVGYSGEGAPGEPETRPGIMFDDATILAMCDDGSTEGMAEEVPQAAPTSHNISSPPPNGFGMEGSTINISHSRDIHFGAKTVAPPSFQPHNFPQGPSSPAPSCDTSVGGDIFNDMTSSFSSINLEDVGVNGFPSPSPSPQTEREEGVASPVFVSMYSTSSMSETVSQTRRTSYQSSSVTSSMSALRKCISSPPTDIAPPSTSSLSSTAFQCQPHQPQGRLMEVSQPTSGPPQMSAAINNSSNVQFGPRIIYNLHYKLPDHPEQRNTPIPPHTPHPSAASLSESLHTSGSKASISVDAPNDYLMKFKKQLTSVYQRRTRSSPLPWHRGKQLIPINEYYTEPEILAVDKVGKQTSETVNITSLLNSRNETRFLVEGEAGMGKTLLATKLAEEWANGVHLQQFQILLFVTLGDFKGSLHDYVKEELLQSYFEAESFENVWEYCKTHDNEILFVLDGYDELKRQYKREIQSLLKSQDFPESKVVVTSRPNFLQDWEMKIVVSGFGQLQIMEFIEKYFRAIGDQSCGQSLRKIIEKDEKYWKLAKRPLFCVLMCLLYMTRGVGKSLPDRQSDVMLQIILCLIKWNKKNNENVPIDFDSLPPEYEKPFLNFGKLCLDALKNEKSRFSDQDVQRVEGFGSKLEQLGFLYSDNESHALGEKKFWKPVHQTFLEYLGAFYIAKHIRNCIKHIRNCKECREYGMVFNQSQEVLKFCIGILNNKAYKILDGQRFPFLWKLPFIRILRLLKEAEPRSENFQAIAKLLDQNTVEISTSEVEFEGWSYILAQPFRRLRSLQIAWRIKSKSPDQESSFTEASETQYQNFFEALKNNESIQSIHVRAKQDGEPFTEEKISMFFSHLQRALRKKNLHELHIVEMKMKASSFIRRTFEVIANEASRSRALHDLQILKIHTFMEDQDLKGICDALAKCAPSLETLHLEGLEHGQAGFSSLVKLLKGNSNIKNLHISMNQSLFVNVLGSCENSAADYDPKEMGNEYKKLHRTAGRRSKHAFNAQSTENEIGSLKSERDNNFEREPDPRKELAFLFEKIPLNNGQWSLEARQHWYLSKASSDFRIPLPVCINREHKSVFHVLFKELPHTHVKNLTLSQAGLYLTLLDLICLGDAVRSAPHLNSLDIQSLEKIEHYLPLLIGMGRSPALASVNLFSRKVTLRDAAYEVVCSALQNNTSLRKLSLGRWRFHLQNVKLATSKLKEVLNSWQVAHLDLKQCVIELGSSLSSLSEPQTPTSPCTEPLTAFFSLPMTRSSQTWKSLKSISLEGVELKEQTGLIHRAHLLLNGLTNFSNLSSLDLSMSEGKSLQVDNIAVRHFFGLIGSKLKHLQELKLGYWKFCLESKENGNDISSSLHSCKKLRIVQLERVNEIVPEFSLHKSENSSSWCKLTFLHQLVSSTPTLEEVSLCYYKINGALPDLDLAVRMSQCLHDHWSHLPFTVKFFNLRSEIEEAIYTTLKKPPYFVKRTSGLSPIRTFKVRNVINLMREFQ